MMPRPQQLSILPASAGSGKTYAIQHALGNWIANRTVRPDRVVAVTFTEAAASELRERISLHLMELGRVEDALLLDQAYISTIHGFGLRILREFAFDGGHSPLPRLLNTDEETALVRRALARTDKADSVADELASFGYSFDFRTRRSGVDQFRDKLLAVMRLFRSVGVTGPEQLRGLAQPALDDLERWYGPSLDGEDLEAKLRIDSRNLLKTYPECLEPSFANSKAASRDLVRDFKNLQNAALSDDLGRDWKLWEQLRKLRSSNRSCKLPQAYDMLTLCVRDGADKILQHPGPLRQERIHLSSLLEAAFDILQHYELAKRQAGLVDYTDMIAGAERLLRERPEVLQVLAKRVDCLVVDEFQDTNPLQFALLWRLSAAGVPTMIVGDVKQAIMGFQGADPRLFEALIRNHEGSVKALTRNWRSQPKLMDVVNALGATLFGQACPPLEPKARPGLMQPLEFVRFRKRAPHRVRAAFVGMRLRDMLADGQQRVRDRRTGELRRLRGGDIAVLCPTHSTLEIYASVLRELGLEVSHQADGWLACRAVQLAWHALAYLANPCDRHAALYLAVTELGSLTLEQGLAQLADGKPIEDPLLASLDELSEGLADRTVSAAVAGALGMMGLLDAVSEWPDSEQARANLVHLMGLASEFTNSSAEALAHGGYYGSGLATFLAWLQARAEESDTQPPKKVRQDNAVRLMTWHSSKGLEWPVVAACGLERRLTPRMGQVDCQYDSFQDLSQLLDRVRIDYSPAYPSKERNVATRAFKLRDAEEEARRLLYVLLTRARDKLLIEWPEHLQFKEDKAEISRRHSQRALRKLLKDKQRREHRGTAPGKRWNSVPMRSLLAGAAETRSYWSLLATGRRRCILDNSGNRFIVEGTTWRRRRFVCHTSEGLAGMPPGLRQEAPRDEEQLPVIGRRAIRRARLPSNLAPDTRAPSDHGDAESEAPHGALRAAQYGEGLSLDLDLSGAELGDFLHRSFEVLGRRPDLSGRLASATGVSTSEADTTRIVTAVVLFESWLAATFQIRDIRREWPVLRLDSKGSVVSGTVDLLVDTPEGTWVIDHKSDKVEDPEAGFSRYRPQLEDYARALEAEGKSVAGLAINWTRRGEVWLERLR